MQCGIHSRGFNRLMPVSEALAALAAVCVEIAPVETSIENAAERIAASPICAPIAVPPVSIALRDGWAVSTQDTVGASAYAPGLAGQPPRLVGCGDPLPDHADAVLPLSCVNAFSSPIGVLRASAPGEGVRARGSDFAAGEVIVPAGAKLRRDHVPLCRLAGVETVSLRIPHVGVVVCGGLRDADRAGAWVASMSAKEGAESRLHAIDALTADLAEAMSGSPADFIIIIGALGSGCPTVQIIAGAGEVLACGIAIHPGETMGCGFLRSGTAGNLVPIVFVSARIENVLAAWLSLVRPSLRRLAAAAGVDRGEALPLKRKIVSSSGISDLVLLRRTSDADNGAVWEPLAISDIRLIAMAQADAWLLVPPECEGYAAGEKICAQFL